MAEDSRKGAMEPGSITRLLDDVREAAPGAEDRLFDRVYDELRDIAAGRLAGERPGAGADASGGGGSTAALVHDAYERLADDTFENRRHLFFAYTRVMRQVLVDRARRTGALKRGGGRARATLDDAANTAGPPSPALTAEEVAELLEKLRAVAPREAEVVELRFFGGLGDDVIGDVLGLSSRTVRQDWSKARQRLAAWAPAS